YELTKESIQAPNVKRTGDFRKDRNIRTGSSHPYDYKRSGYDRGHLTPAGDMAFSKNSMSSTFLMSNISPQIRGFNGGVWRELEENVRDWAYSFRHLYVVSGPVLTRKPLTYIGDNQVAVPSYYYKVLLDVREPEEKGIAFLLPNEVTDKHLREFAVPIDQVEELTGIDFFPNLLPSSQIENLERNIDISKWKFDEGKFNSRVRNWNNR
ncbi:MAG: DNA/RNA non-specific endonuclease, partial [Saprospiraceae bacterium]|nr:DNA/RNA non-specific endonuclease [Saprospiraceae bacterium]